MALFVPKTTGFVARRGVRDFSVGATSLDEGIHDGSYCNVFGDHSPRATAATATDATLGLSGYSAPTGASGDINQIVFQGAVGMAPADQEVTGVQTLLAPIRHALGINISQTATNALGVQYAFGGVNRGTLAVPLALFTRNRFQHLVGTTGDSFFKATIYIEDASGVTVSIGWRLQEVFQAALTSYTNLAGLQTSGSGAAGIIQTKEIAATVLTTSATLAATADATAYTFEVRISKAGRVTYFFNLATATTPTQLNPGTVYTAVAGTYIPYLHLVQTADISEVYLQNFQIGRRRSVDPDRSSLD